MSAILSSGTKTERAPAKLRSVRPPRQRIARMPFMVVLASILVLGMVGLLALNTALQTQATELSAAQQQATELGYQVSALESTVSVLRAPSDLARKASALGMRPNPYAAFIVLPDGTIIGNPTPVAGNELPSMTWPEGR